MTDRDGKRFRRLFATKAAAEEKRDELLVARRKGTRAAGSETFAEAAEIYMRIIEKVGRNGRRPVEPEAVAQYRKSLERDVLPKVGSMPIAKISAPDVVAFRNYLVMDSGKGSATIKKAFVHYRGVLQEAFNHGLIDANVWAGISLAGEARKSASFDNDLGLVKGSIPSRQEVAQLLRTAAELRADPRALMGGHDSAAATWQKYTPTDGPRGWREVKTAWRKYHVLLLTAVLTGMRQGELRALTWSAVNFSDRLIHVRASATATGRIKAPKSAAGVRNIELADELIDELKAWRPLCPVGGYVFPNAAGGVLAKENLYKRLWQRLLEFSGITGYTFHALRHHYASQLIAAGADPKEIQTALGHADIQTTFNIYGHLFPEDRAARRARIQGIAAGILADAAPAGVADLSRTRRAKSLKD